MNPREFIDTIYLSDRFCKSILIDGYNEKVKIEINTISRIRSKSGTWEYYNCENIENGLIVFDGVKSILIEPKGFIPNDEIELVSAELIEGEKEVFLFGIEAGYGDSKGGYTRGEIKIIAEGIHLEDPMKQGIKITE